MLRTMWQNKSTHLQQKTVNTWQPSLFKSQESDLVTRRENQEKKQKTNVVIFPSLHQTNSYVTICLICMVISDMII